MVKAARLARFCVTAFADAARGKGFITIHTRLWEIRPGHGTSVAYWPLPPRLTTALMAAQRAPDDGGNAVNASMIDQYSYW